MQTQRVLSAPAQKQKEICENMARAGSESKTYKPQAENKVTVMGGQVSEEGADIEWTACFERDFKINGHQERKSIWMIK